MRRGFVCARRHPCCFGAMEKGRPLLHIRAAPAEVRAKVARLDPTEVSATPKGHRSSVVVHFMSCSFNSIRIHHHWRRNRLGSPCFRDSDLPYSLCPKMEIILKTPEELGFIATSVFSSVTSCGQLISNTTDRRTLLKPGSKTRCTIIKYHACRCPSRASWWRVSPP